MLTLSDINNPDVVAELKLLSQEYEQALITNDVEALNKYFWQSSEALRFGITEELYGNEAISTFRKNRVINFTERTTLRNEIVTFGNDIGVVTTEFSVSVSGNSRHGRQSQVWIRFAEQGWQIVSAHVSHNISNYLSSSEGSAGLNFAKAASVYLKIPFDPKYLNDVALNLDVMAAVAEPLLNTELPDTLDPAPEFQP